MELERAKTIISYLRKQSDKLEYVLNICHRLREVFSQLERSKKQYNRELITFLLDTDVVWEFLTSYRANTAVSYLDRILQFTADSSRENLNVSFILTRKTQLELQNLLARQLERHRELKSQSRLDYITREHFLAGVTTAFEKKIDSSDEVLSSINAGLTWLRRHEKVTFEPSGYSFFPEDRNCLEIGEFRTASAEMHEQLVDDIQSGLEKIEKRATKFEANVIDAFNMADVVTVKKATGTYCFYLTNTPSLLDNYKELVIPPVTAFLMLQFAAMYPVRSARLSLLEAEISDSIERRRSASATESTIEAYLEGGNIESLRDEDIKIDLSSVLGSTERQNYLKMWSTSLIPSYGTEDEVRSRRRELLGADLIPTRSSRENQHQEMVLVQYILPSERKNVRYEKTSFEFLPECQYRGLISSFGAVVDFERSDKGDTAGVRWLTYKDIGQICDILLSYFEVVPDSGLVSIFTLFGDPIRFIIDSTGDFVKALTEIRSLNVRGISYLSLEIEGVDFKYTPFYEGFSGAAFGIHTYIKELNNFDRLRNSTSFFEFSFSEIGEILNRV